MKLRLLPCALLALCFAAPAAAQEPLLPELRSASRRRGAGVEARRAYAVALVRAGHYRDAEREYRQVARLSRRDPQVLLEAAEAVFASGNFNASRRACRNLERATERDSVWSRICRAKAFLVAHRSARAFEELEVAIAERPDLYEAHLALGEAYRFRAERDPAVTAYRRAAELNPTSAAPHLGLGRLYAALGQSDDAIAALRQAIALEANWPAVQFELGRLLDTAEGRTLLRQAITGRPDWAEAQAAYGAAELEAGELTAARTALERAIALDAELAPAHAALGRTLLAQAELPLAEASLQRALELVRNDARSATALAEIFARTERYEEALEQYRAAADMNPRDPTPLIEGGRLAYRLRRHLLAAAYLDRALDVNENYAPALVLYGDIMVARRMRTRARAYYTDALSASDGEIDRAEVERKLAELGE